MYHAWDVYYNNEGQQPNVSHVSYNIYYAQEDEL